MANYSQHFRSQFGDTTYTKVFVGGLAWETPTEEMHRYFEQFGDILEAVIITDKLTGKSKGYGFVTFRDPESARRACANPNPVIDGRRANCNIASFGRPRPSPPRSGRTAQQSSAASYSGVAMPPPPPPPPVPPLIYPPYGTYPSYTSPDYAYHQGLYNPQVQQQQYYQQMYGTSTSSTMISPYYYGYSLQSPRPSTFSTVVPHSHRLPGPAPSYLYYPTQIEGSLIPSYPSTLRPPTSQHFPPPDTQSSHDSPEDTDQAGAITSESPNTGT